ncbi:Maltose excess protein 1, chloroplastic [Cocos nucifera]|nr:Maltose excess protein 1, chloroplastic [Cocos nucifera]
MHAYQSTLLLRVCSGLIHLRSRVSPRPHPLRSSIYVPPRDPSIPPPKCVGASLSLGTQDGLHSGGDAAAAAAPPATSTLHPFLPASLFVPLPSLPLLKSHHHPPKPLKRFLPAAPLLLPRRSPPSAVSDSPHRPSVEGSSVFRLWDSLTAKFTGAANVPFLLLQLPQIVLNARNLLAGNKAALFAVPWLGMLTGLLGNLSLLSYFAKKKETEAVLIQTLGVLSNYVVIAQLAMAEAMPMPQFALTSAAVASGLVLNFFNYFGWLHDWIWRIWEDFITIGGVAVLPQVMWSTFLPYIPNSILPGLFSGVIAVVAVIMARTGKLSDGGIKFVGSISGWTATLLFMWMPVAHMWTNYLHPDNIKGLSAFTMLLAMIGNGLMIPRALFIRDLMW